MKVAKQKKEWRSAGYKPYLYYFSVFSVLWVIALLYAGAYTTSIQAGMAFLDWPLSNSSINPEGWLTDEDMRAEHSHRLLGAKLGLLSIGLVIWTQLREKRRAIRWLAIAILAVIILQGLLGGMRVLFDQINTGAASNLTARSFAVLHACGAEVTVCLLIALATTCSRFWIERNAGQQEPASSSVRFWGVLAVLALGLQIIFGAVMRHAGAGLAIPTFPLTPSGGVLPDIWNFPILIHWLHRLGAIIATVAILIFTIKLLSNKGSRKAMGALVYTVLGLLIVQILLGAATIWTYKNPLIASNHMVVGALLLGSTWMLTLLTFRLRRSKANAQAQSASPTAPPYPQTEAKAL